MSDSSQLAFRHFIPGRVLHDPYFGCDVLWLIVSITEKSDGLIEVWFLRTRGRDASMKRDVYHPKDNDLFHERLVVIKSDTSQ